MRFLSSFCAYLPQVSLLSLKSLATNQTAMSTRSGSPCGSGRSSPSIGGADSGYASGNNSESDMPELYFTRPHIRFLNRQLQFLEPQEILKWAITTLPHLYQTTAFGLTGLVSLDMMSKLKIPRPQMVDLVFLDTVHHFSETLELVDRVRAKYPLVNIHTFKPAGVETAEEFKDKHGDKLWETDDTRYDYLVKVEPAQRAYRELNAYAVLTGRRRTQGGGRGSLDIIEVDEAGLLKINP